MALAESLLDVEGHATRCEALPSLVPEEWQPSGTLSRGGGSTGDIEFESCAISLDVAERARVRLGGASGRAWFDESAKFARGIMTATSGIGDDAIAIDDNLFIRVEDTGIVVSFDKTEAPRPRWSGLWPSPRSSRSALDDDGDRYVPQAARTGWYGLV